MAQSPLGLGWEKAGRTSEREDAPPPRTSGPSGVVGKERGVMPMKNNMIEDRAEPTAENAAMFSNVVGYVGSGSRVSVRNGVTNVHVGLFVPEKGAVAIVGAIKALASVLAGIGKVLARLVPNQWSLSLKIGHFDDTLAPRLN